MHKITVLFILSAIFLSGCYWTPVKFRKEHTNKMGKYSTYNVTDYDDGFLLEMTYVIHEVGGISEKTTFTARNKIKALAQWIADARQRKIKPINVEDIDSCHVHNQGLSQSRWQGSVRVYYTDKKTASTTPAKDTKK